MHSINNRIKLSKSKLVALAQTCLNPAMGRPILLVSALNILAILYQLELKESFMFC